MHKQQQAHFVNLQAARVCKVEAPSFDSFDRRVFETPALTTVSYHSPGAVTFLWIECMEGQPSIRMESGSAGMKCEAVVSRA